MEISELPTDCPFCEYEPDVDDRTNTSQKSLAHSVYAHASQKHPKKMDSLPSHPLQI